MQGRNTLLSRALHSAWVQGLVFTCTDNNGEHPRKSSELAEVPVPFRGLPMAFVVTGLIALAFTGFSGLITL